MAALSPASAAAIARLRSYVPPPTTWYSLPLTRRAAVLILLFADKRGDLRVVLTMRSAALKSYSGQAALPGGKSDTLYETPVRTARREAFEEIGLPLPNYADATPSSSSSIDSDMDSILTEDPSLSVPLNHPYSTKYNPPTPDLPKPFILEHLCQLPTNLAKTELGVRPCVAFISVDSNHAKENGAASTAEVETTLIPRLDAKEVAAVFSGPFSNFLKLNDERDESIKGDWYKGSWIDWYETSFRMHNFYVPVKGYPVTKPKQKKKDPQQQRIAYDATMRLQTDSESRGRSISDKSKKGLEPQNDASYPKPSHTIPYRDIPKPHDESNPDPLDALDRFRVFGMTARILVDCARVAYGVEPEFEHNAHFGDEGIIQRLIDVGKFETERGSGDEFVGNDLTNALQGQGFGGLIRDAKTASRL